MFYPNAHPQKRFFRNVIFLGLVVILIGKAPFSFAAEAQNSLKSSKPLPDLSGLAWMEDDLLITVHDAKNPDELDRPRVSLMALPTSLKGVLWRPANPVFPNKKSSDLESAARIPGTAKVLLYQRHLTLTCMSPFPHSD